MLQGYNLGLIGSRHYNNYEEFCQAIEQVIQIHGRPSNIVSGGHLDKHGHTKPGTDTLAWKWAQDNNVPIIEHEAEWDKYGRAAGPIRNKLIVRDSHIILAAIAPDSTGTWNTINQAKDNPKIIIYSYSVP